jgi:hypothetical protein
LNILKKDKKKIISNIFLSKYIGLVLGLICVLITIFVWKTVEVDSLVKLSQNVELKAKIYAGKVEGRIDNIDFNLDELAWHGPPNTLKEEEDWDIRADFYIQNLIGISNIVWIDRDLIVRRIMPTENSEYIINKEINSKQNKSDYTNLMIPIYNEFADQGFTIIGVACEYKSTEALKKRMEIEKFPWINLLELDNQNGIWDKYGVSNSGGRTFMVDSKGKILAINPTAAEVRELLNKLL